MEGRWSPHWKLSFPKRWKQCCNCNFSWYWLLELVVTSHRKSPVLFGGLVYFIVVGCLFVCYFFNIKQNYYFCLQKFAVCAQVKRRQTEEAKRNCKKILASIKSCSHSCISWLWLGVLNSKSQEERQQRQFCLTYVEILCMMWCFSSWSWQPLVV